MSTIKKCKDCGISYPETRDYFGQYKNQRKGGVTIGFRNSCRKCMASRTSRHSELNPLMVKKRQQRRANAEESAQGEFTDDDIIFIRSQVADNCRFCGTPLNGKGEIEHLTPVTRGGSHNRNNLTLSCPKCNKEKTNKTQLEYLEWRRERNLNVRNLSFPHEKPDPTTSARGRKSYDTSTDWHQVKRKVFDYTQVKDVIKMRNNKQRIGKSERVVNANFIIHLLHQMDYLEEKISCLKEKNFE